MYKWIPVFIISLTFMTGLKGEDQHSNEALIRKKTQEYVSAYNNKDAEALAKLWQEKGVYTNLDTGRTVTGRDQIREEFAKIFEEEPNLKLKVSTHSIVFPTESTAIEEGTASVIDANGNKETTRYRVVFENENGEWYLTSESEVEKFAPPSHYEQLKDLEWLIGEWEDADDDIAIESKYEWDKYKNFIKHTYSVKVLGKEELEGKRIIGWDPANEVIRSWNFDSLGGFAEATWGKVGRQWVIESLNTLPDGGIGSQIQVMTPEGRNAFTYQISGRVVDGEILPNIDPVKIVRKKG